MAPYPRGSRSPVRRLPAPQITSEKRVIVGDQVELPRVYLAWVTDPIFSQGDAECDLIARILGGGKSSRLYKSLVYDKRIAQDVHAQHLSLALGSVFVIEATGKPGVEPQQLENAIREELEQFQADGPKPAELERARNTMESAIIRALENIGGFADRLNLYNHFLEDPGYLPRDLERYQKASIGSLQKLCAEETPARVRRSGLGRSGFQDSQRRPEILSDIRHPALRKQPKSRIRTGEFILRLPDRRLG